jgi:hypothetical protein
MEALFHLSKGFAITSSTTSQLFEYASLFSFPVFATAFLKQAIEVLLGFPSTFFYGRNKVLLVSMTKIACYIRVLERLEGGESSRGVQVCDRAGKGRGVNVSLCQKVVPVITRLERDGLAHLLCSSRSVCIAGCSGLSGHESARLSLNLI